MELVWIPVASVVWAPLLPLHGALQATEVVTLGRDTMRTINQNLLWALAYNVVGIPLAAGVRGGGIGAQVCRVSAEVRAAVRTKLTSSVNQAPGLPSECI